jgi:hypothetical protein
LTFAAEGMGRAAIQMGMLADSVAALTKSAAIAEMATGIGLIVTVLGAAVILWDELPAKEEKAAEKADDYKKVWKEASIQSNENTLRQSLREAAEAIRRVEVGAEAAHALILGHKYQGQALAAFALGDAVGGAGLEAAAIQEFAASAAGFDQAGGGGGGSGGGDGGS